MVLTFVDRDGVSHTVESKMTILEIIECRYEDMTPWIPYYAHLKSEDTITGMSGLSWQVLDVIRRSQIWEDEVVSFVNSTDGLELTEKTRRDLGILPRDKKSYKGKFPKSGYKEIGQVVMSRLTDNDQIPEGKMVTLEWAIESVKIIFDWFDVSDDIEIPQLPDKPMTQAEELRSYRSKADAMRAEIESLKSQIESLSNLA